MWLHPIHFHKVLTQNILLKQNYNLQQNLTLKDKYPKRCEILYFNIADYTVPLILFSNTAFSQKQKLSFCLHLFVISALKYFPSGGIFLVLGITYFFCMLDILNIILWDSVFYLNLFYQICYDTTSLREGGNASLLPPMGRRRDSPLGSLPPQRDRLLRHCSRLEFRLPVRPLLTLL